MERTPCNYLHLVEVGQWVIVRNNRSGRETPSQVTRVDAERTSFSTAAHTFVIHSPLLAEDIKNCDLVALAIPEGLPVGAKLPVEPPSYDANN